LDGRCRGVWDVLHRVLRLLLVIVGLGDGGSWVVRAVGRGWVSRAGGCCGWSRRGSVAGGVEYFGHLAVVDAVGVIAEGHVGVFVLEGLGFALTASTMLSAGGGRDGGCGGVDVKVPGRRGKLVPGWRVIEQVGGVHLIGRSQVGDWSSSACSSPLFMQSRGWRLWYSFIRCGACKLVTGSQVLSLSG
jgi:hypothetical protein